MIDARHISPFLTATAARVARSPRTAGKVPHLVTIGAHRAVSARCPVHNRVVPGGFCGAH